MKNVKEILTAKKNKVERSNSGNSEKGQGTIYQCPMKCEGEKTYEEPGNCPVCNMHLKPVS